MQKNCSEQNLYDICQMLNAPQDLKDKMAAFIDRESTVHEVKPA